MSRNTGRPKGPSQRQLRVGEVIRHALAEVFEREEFRDPVLAEATITVTEVRSSPDMRNATVFIMPLGGQEIGDVVTALGRAAPYLRRLLGERVTMKRLPALSFEVDTSFDQAQRIDDLLRSEVQGEAEERRDDQQEPLREPAGDSHGT